MEQSSGHYKVNIMFNKYEYISKVIITYSYVIILSLYVYKYNIIIICICYLYNNMYSYLILEVALLPAALDE